jgi:hypothetical protein
MAQNEAKFAFWVKIDTQNFPWKNVAQILAYFCNLQKNLPNVNNRPIDYSPNLVTLGVGIDDEMGLMCTYPLCGKAICT